MTGSTVSYNPDGKEDGKDGIVNSDGSVGRPPQVGLGHELEHAGDDASGTNNTKSILVKDPDQGNKTVPISKSEYKIRTISEQKIRNEQKAEQRATPIVVQ